MEFWNSLLTEKSLNILKELKKEKFRFILIGGWAVYLLTKQHKSKDVDIIIPDLKDLEILKKRYSLIKNDNLKKYEIKIEEIDIDVYVNYYSKFIIPINEIETIKIESFEVIKPEFLLILKQNAELERKDSVKGSKDIIDIITILCYSNININNYKNLLKKYKIEDYKKRLKEIIISFKDLKYLNLSFNEYRKIKKDLLNQL